MTRSFERFTGGCAIAAGIGGVAYSIAFVIFLQSGSRPAAKIAAGLLLVGGLVVMAAMTGAYGRVRATDPGFALLALVLGVAAGAGSAAHGAYDLANFVKPPGALPTAVGNLPNPVDPRGLMTFAVSGIAVFVLGWLILQGAILPRRLGQLAGLAGVLLVLVYLGRLIILNPKNPAVLLVAIASGFLATPAFFVWLGMELRREAGPAAPLPS